MKVNNNNNNNNNNKLQQGLICRARPGGLTMVAKTSFFYN